LAAILACERMWALRYHWYIRPKKDNEYRKGGTLQHTGYRYYYANMMEPAARPGWFYQKSMHDSLVEEAEDFQNLIPMAYENTAAYAQFYPNDDRYIRPIAIEEEFKATLGELDPDGPWPELNGEVVTCRTDLLFADPEGWEWVMDYKSRGRSKVNMRTGRLRPWRTDGGEFTIFWQGNVNLWILRARRGPVVKGFIIQRSTRQPPHDFDRQVLEIPLMAYNETPRQLRVAVKKECDLIERMDAGELPNPNYSACMGRFGPCDYRYACAAKNKGQMMYRLMTEGTYVQSDPAEILRIRNALRAA
jgi:hypothetical protein